MMAIATLGEATAEPTVMRKIREIEDNIFRFFDGEVYRSKMTVDTKYNDAFRIALLCASYANVHLERRLKMKVFAKRLTKVEQEYWSRDEKDELTIRMNYNGKIRTLTISRR